jgi:outer membrane lipoprotein SlyB
MKKISAAMSIAIVSISGMLLAGCITQPTRSAPYEQAQYYDVQGTIQNIETVLTRDSQPSGAGAVGGAIIGGILGHQVGKGTGKTLATVAGAAAGAYGGNEVEKNYAGTSQSYRITVRARDGRLLSYVQDDAHGFRIGDRVRVSNNRVFADY